MWSVIISFVGGVIITGLVVLVRGYSNTQQSESNSKAAQDRLEAAEKEAEVQRLKRLKEIEDAASKINDSGSATDALDQLRKQFPGSSNSSSH